MSGQHASWYPEALRSATTRRRVARLDALNVVFSRRYIQIYTHTHVLLSIYIYI